MNLDFLKLNSVGYPSLAFTVIYSIVVASGLKLEHS